VGAVDECLGEIELAASLQVLCECVQDAIDRSVAHPVLKPPVAGLIGRISRWKIFPRRTGAKNPKHAVQDVARIAIRPASNALLHRFLDGEQRPQKRPLLFGEVHRNL